MTDYDPLREYKRVVRDTNSQKLRLASIRARLNAIDEVTQQVLRAVAELEEEGEAHLRALRDRSPM
jgi:hypothetical protein